MRRTGISALAVGAAALAACGLFPDLGQLGGVDATAEAAADAATESASDGGADARACLGTEGPVSVAVGGFCIDSTEVTNAQYAQFLASSPDLTQLPATCTGWKTTFKQSTPPPLGSDDYPAVWVDWCDAYAFCAWAGKRLCGRIGGGPLAPAGLGDPTQDEWYVACSSEGAYAYPYGGAFDASICNGPEREAGSVLPATSLPSCTGGVPGLFEMVGNADEWIDSCKTSSSGPDAGYDECERRSGSFDDPAGSLQTCAFGRTGTRLEEDWDIGFRCCSDLAP